MKSGSVREVEEWGADSPPPGRIRDSAEQLTETILKAVKTEATAEVATELNEAIPVLALPPPDAALRAFGVSIDALRAGTVPQAVAGKAVTAISHVMGARIRRIASSSAPAGSSARSWWR
ncbi:hypothetical protein GCM10027176_05230 [Actinoallomurus bryophytorum]|uniref:Uncharacterized protein n=1 Tax=Actinoallomurus bryophytorum TaxID=1490222 RepID=A0A543CJD8_9ACTN|nr:hypothetical protein [Actinoallomurus bryophytorum]TQL97209.1 hypothetical protein FB559_2787 [Actinoallomurus bryophytorum]